MSDVTLYPIRGQVAQINGKNEFIVYVPRADKYTYGTVKIGDGLLGEDGIISLDRSEITILEIQKNGVKINPVDKKVNIVLSKTDVGLENVDNTADADKPVSMPTQNALNQLRTELTDDVMNVSEELTDYKETVSQRFNTERQYVDTEIASVNRTITNNKETTDTELLRLNALVKEKGRALAYPSYMSMINALNMAATNAYAVGQSIFIKNVDVPDLWVYGVENNHIDYVYSGDEAFLNELSLDGTIQVGYYTLAMMETKTTDIENVVTLDTAQTITGTKIFQEQIGLLNGNEGDINYIKHINNNFLLSSNDGENIINIDEQLKTFNFYNKPIALQEYVDDNYISHSFPQNLSDEQKAMARDNIGVGSSVDLSNYVTKTDYATSSTPGIVLVLGTYGVAVNDSGMLYLSAANNTEISEKQNNYKPITAQTMDYAVKSAMTTNTETWSANERQSARTLVGAVGDTDYATSSKGGVVKVGAAANGIKIDTNGTLYLSSATTTEIDNRTSTIVPIIPSNLEYAVKSGLTRNNLSWAESEKEGVRTLIGAVDKTYVDDIVGDIETLLSEV